MCGFAGIFAPQGARFERAVLEAMAAKIRHRGPDDQGFCSASFATRAISTSLEQPGHVALAFNRLSIVDLTPSGHQPMVTDDGQQVIAFNGEMYNAPQLRPELEQAREKFRGHSDTEVLLRAIRLWGLEPALERSNGMFAFAFADVQRGVLVLARDRLGIKPLYWWADGRQVLFASEVKAFLAHPAFRAELDEDRLDEYLAYRFTARDRFLLRGVRQLLPGSTLTFDGSLTPGVRRWWQVPERRAERGLSLDEAARRVEQQLDRSVQLQLMSDVPLGCQLSGGIDSSLVSVFANRHAGASGNFQGFSVVVAGEQLSEERWIDDAARVVGAPVHKFPFATDDFVARIEHATWHLDQPLNHPNSIAISFLAEHSRPHVTVLLSGEGADETFGGYPRFMRLGLLPWLRPVAGALSRLPKVGAKLAPFSAAAARDPVDWFLKSTSQMSAHELARLRPGAHLQRGIDSRRAAFPASGTLLSRCLANELETYVVDLLVRQDKMTMAHSLENRVPLLDHELVELAATLPESHLVRLRPTADPSLTRSTKVVLKEVARHHFDDAFVFRAKQAFGMPLRESFATPGMKLLMEEKVLPSVRRRKLFDPGAVESAWRRAPSEPLAAEALWTCVAFELWALQFLDGRHFAST